MFLHSILRATTASARATTYLSARSIISGTRLDIAWVNVRVWVGPFCGGLTVAAIAPPAAIEVVALVGAIVALDIKCINIK